MECCEATSAALPARRHVSAAQAARRSWPSTDVMWSQALPPPAILLVLSKGSASPGAQKDAASAGRGRGRLAEAVSARCPPPRQPRWLFAEETTFSAFCGEAVCCQAAGGPRAPSRPAGACSRADSLACRPAQRRRGRTPGPARAGCWVPSASAVLLPAGLPVRRQTPCPRLRPESCGALSWMAGGTDGPTVNKSCGLGDIVKHLTFALVVYFVISAQQLTDGIINLSLPVALASPAPWSLLLRDDRQHPGPRVTTPLPSLPRARLGADVPQLPGGRLFGSSHPSRKGSPLPLADLQCSRPGHPQRLSL